MLPPCPKEQLEQCPFPLMLNQCIGGTFVVDVHSGYILMPNENACKILGYTKDEIQQLRVPDIQVGVAFKSQLEWQAFSEKIKSNGDKKTIIRGRVRCKNGSTFPSQTVVSYRVHEGKEVLFAHFSDISSTVRLEGKLFDMQERFRLSFECAPIPVAIISMNKKFLQVNPAFCNLLGYTEKDLVDLSYDFALLEDDKTAFEDDCCSTLLEKRYRHKNGKIIYIHLSINPVNDTSGELQYYVMQIIDLSEKRKMEEQLLQAHRQSSALSKRLLLIQEEERRRIARELHDHLGQVLMAQKLICNSLSFTEALKNSRKLDDLKSLIDESIATVRHVSTGLHSTLLDNLGLVDAIENEIKKLNQRGYIQFSFTANNVPDSLPDKIKSAYFRVFQEATTNILRHSEATCASISLEITQQQLVMNIQDNGKGLITSTLDKTTSLGVLSMKERLSSIDGEFYIGNKVGGIGTEIKATLELV